MHDGLRRRFFVPWALSLLGCLGGLWFMTGVSSTAQALDQIDWTTWESIPALDRGRLMPLDTFARGVVRDICGRENPKLSPPENIETLDPKTKAAIEQLFPEGKPRKFSAAELFYCWTIQPEVWDHIPFLKASNQTLREKGLEVPIFSESGKRLTHVTPLDFEEAPKIYDLHDELAQRQRQAKRESREYEPSREDEALLELISAYNLYRSVVFNPSLDERVGQSFQNQFLDVIEIWRSLAPNLGPWLQVADSQDGLSVSINRVKDAIQLLSEQVRLPKTKLSQLAVTASELADAANELTLNVEKLRTRIFEAEGTDEAFLKKGREMMNRLAAETGQLARSACLLEISVYDEGRSLRVLPALNRWALEKERDASMITQPWINLQTLLYSPEVVLDGFPQEAVASLRETFEASKQDFLEVQGKLQEGDAKKFNASLEKFAKQLRALGETLSAEREKLELHEPDEVLLAQTAYPPVGVFDVELKYNRLDPFLWSWVLTLAAVLFFALALGYLRTPMVVLAIVLLTLGQIATCYGLGLRMAITKMVPVTNMHETILFVGATTGILTIGFAIFPLIQAGLGTAWRLTAWPLGTEARSLDEVQRRVAGPLASGGFRWLLFVIRLGLVAVLLYLLTMIPFSPDGQRSVLGLLPSISGKSLGGMLGAVVLWIVGGSLLAWTVWFVPRAVPATVLALVLTPVSWIQLGFREGLQRTADHRLYLIAGSVVALMIYLVGYWTPHSVFNRDVGMGMAVALRNNFWLAIHVLVITASYGAGALAWGIGNISAAFYLFGKYKEGESPKMAHTLANYIYRMMQIAVLLLAAGTITGAIWADFAWGRYWGWDPKEVWALITLFVYLAILHGRWARWIGDFGMAFGAVLGFTSIIIAWYGVNLINDGLHSYGAVSGGFLYVIIGAVLNWLFVIGALLRYLTVQSVVEPKEMKEE